MHHFNNKVVYQVYPKSFKDSNGDGEGDIKGIIEKLDYLKELGVNQIQCMPVYEFEECGKTKVNYWGYGKGFYFAYSFCIFMFNYSKYFMGL